MGCIVQNYAYSRSSYHFRLGESKALKNARQILPGILLGKYCLEHCIYVYNIEMTH